MKKVSFTLLCLISVLNFSCNSDTKQESKNDKKAVLTKPITPKATPVAPPKKIVIQPYGDFPQELLKKAEEGITNMYKLNVVILKSVSLPEMAYFKPRNRYKADSLLVDLEGRQVPQTFKIIGLTEKDISTKSEPYEDWGIFGLGSISDKTCVVSTFRLKYGNASDELLSSRLIKVINHEIGHTLGLQHCPHLNCLMEDANGSIKPVDNESGALCADCAKKVKEYLVK